MTNPILTDSQQMLARALAAKDAEIERLRAALERIDELATYTGQYSFGDIARTALGRPSGA